METVLSRKRFSRQRGLFWVISSFWSYKMILCIITKRDRRPLAFNFSDILLFWLFVNVYNMQFLQSMDFLLLWQYLLGHSIGNTGIQQSTRKKRIGNAGLSLVTVLLYIAKGFIFVFLFVFFNKSKLLKKPVGDLRQQGWQHNSVNLKCRFSISSMKYFERLMPSPKLAEIPRILSELISHYKIITM